MISVTSQVTVVHVASNKCDTSRYRLWMHSGRRPRSSFTKLHAYLSVGLFLAYKQERAPGIGIGRNTSLKVHLMGNKVST